VSPSGPHSPTRLTISAILYVIWNNAWPQQPMGFYLKSFNAKPAPVPGRSYSISQINLLPLPANAIQVFGSYIFAWLSDGPYGGRRWPNIFIGAVYGVSGRLARSQPRT
jgi:ACS family pantothenate transporter-like MFS transporter